MAPSPDTEPDRPTSAIYERAPLATAYDKLVWGFSFKPWAWGPTLERILGFYGRHLSADHLEVGVGTGLLLQRANRPHFDRLHLLDANPGPLQETAESMARHRPLTTRADALADWGDMGAPFASIGCMNVIHCLPDPHRRGIAAKTALLDSAAAVLAPGGTFYGCTLMPGQPGLLRRPFAAPMMALYNRLKWFSNRADTPADLEAELNKRFTGVRVWVEGSLVLWQAAKSV
ncbi:class I SAM-dependent methyltransferase [Streptomonospora nanhaiensis]|uniref:class I SAM-dependent methyltransferase n=1 Tax=Streptomonospora nanhaiensis TaxID=1323731 RepID=UPI001C3856F7|nr:class I SAM-dependent methyltransferase [Streptomonospora nanhaiensis]MBV2366994.1 class I SAM-dependent methyltransferase [Streptomonospora nanhaiensis]MBX9390153.1 class I SAM-dependent methyltransferase [Streptomonospora nanhaiensis]